MRLSSCLIVKGTFLVAAAVCGATNGVQASTPLLLLEGKLRLDLPDGFVADESRITKQVVAGIKARKGGAWGAVVRGAHGLEPDGLGEYLSRKIAEYTKGLSWLPRLTWLKKETVTIKGRKWADLRFIGQLDKPKNSMEGMLYTRILATSYGGQLLEIVVTSNTDREASTKAKIDHIMDSVDLED